MRAILLATALLVPLAGCVNAGVAACDKAKECCARVSECEDINKEGEGFQDRCGIDFQATADSFKTYGNDLCTKIADAWGEYLGCIADVACTDVADDGVIAKCAAAARAFCDARRTSGDACGHDWKNLGCDDAKAKLQDAW